jgi:hypothetical protein
MRPFVAPRRVAFTSDPPHGPVVGWCHPVSRRETRDHPFGNGPSRGAAVADRSDRDARYFPDVVEQIVNLWRDAGSDWPVGQVVVVSGPPQSGRSTVLGQAAADLRRFGIRVVSREARGGSLQSVAGSGTGEHVVQGAKVLAAALQVAGAGAVGNLIALGAEIATTRQLV